MSGYLALGTMENNAEDEDRGNNNPESEGSSSNPDASKLTKEDLLAAVQNGCVEKIKRILPFLNKNDVNHMFGHPIFATSLHVAAQDGATDIVQLLLHSGADPNIRDLRGKKYTALHYAVQNVNADVLKTLLDGNADPNLKEGDSSRTCLHLLPQKWKTKEDDCKECFLLLTNQKRIKLDVLDSSGASPLFMSAKLGWEYMTKELIMHGASIDIKVGSKTVADIIRSKFPGLLESIDFSVIKQPQRYYGDELFEALKSSDIVEFQNVINDWNQEKSKDVSMLDEDHGEYSLLRYACDYGLHEFVALLLNTGVDPRLKDTTNKMSPILYAARNGFYKVLDILIDDLKGKALLESELKHKDRKGETVLHKIVKREYHKKQESNYHICLQKVLNVKRYLNIDAQDEFGFTALHYAVLCDDQSFVRELLLNGANLGIRNNFGSLAITRIQPSVLEEVLNECVRHRNNVTDRDFEIILQYRMLAPTHDAERPETDCLRFLSTSKTHRYLLKHPVIDTFLFLKWQRVRQYYFFNVLAYFMFLAFLTAYIMLFYGAPTDINDVSNTNFTNGDDAASNVIEMSNNYLGIGIFLKVFITLFAIYILVREIIQFLVSWKLYVRRLENWIELTIFVMSMCLLYFPMSNETQQSLSAWLILFSWIEFVHLVGRYPWLAVYITMFFTVSFNFLKFIAMFSFMIFAFCLSFHLVFKLDEPFSTFPKALLKIIAMSTGEFEYGDLPFSAFPVSSGLLFVLFLFLIVLVLMNLLNGLAVSDIQQIQQEAELVSYSSRVELISYIESVFLTAPFQRLLPCTCCAESNQRLTNCCATSNIAIKFLNWLGQRILMFKFCLKDHQITLFPNKAAGRWRVCECHSFHLQETQIEAAKSVVLISESQVANRLESLDTRMDALMTAVSSLTDMVKKHVLCPPPE